MNSCDENIESLKKKLAEIEKMSDDEYADYIKEKYNICLTVFNDTDSAGVSLEYPAKLRNIQICHVDENPENSYVTEEGYKMVEEFDSMINREYEEWAKKNFNTKNVTLNFKREKICDRGIWFKKKDKDEVAKKNYIVHILDNEGVKHPKFKYTGVKLARTTIPKKIKDSAKKLTEFIILNCDRKKADEMVGEIYEDFVNMPIDEKSIIQRVNNIKKYETATKGIPGHVSASLNYNKAITELKLNKYVTIKNGDIVHYVYLKPNKFGFSKIAYLENWPQEFDNHFKIDDELMFKKVIYDEIDRVYNTLNWKRWDPSSGLQCNIEDFFDFVTK